MAQLLLDRGMAVLGGSYGGYMGLATAAFYPDRIRGAVDIVGISSIPTFLRSTAPYRRDLRRAEYGDGRDPAVLAVLERISPLHRVQAIRGGEAWYLLALDEGHGFQKKENRDDQVAAPLVFLERLLSGG